MQQRECTHRYYLWTWFGVFRFCFVYWFINNTSLGVCYISDWGNLCFMKAGITSYCVASLLINNYLLNYTYTGWTNLPEEGLFRPKDRLRFHRREPGMVTLWFSLYRIISESLWKIRLWVFKCQLGLHTSVWSYIKAQAARFVKWQSINVCEIFCFVTMSY